MAMCVLFLKKIMEEKEPNTVGKINFLEHSKNNRMKQRIHFKSGNKVIRFFFLICTHTTERSVAFIDIDRFRLIWPFIYLYQSLLIRLKNAWNELEHFHFEYKQLMNCLVSIIRICANRLLNMKQKNICIMYLMYTGTLSFILSDYFMTFWISLYL